MVNKIIISTDEIRYILSTSNLKVFVGKGTYLVHVILNLNMNSSHSKRKKNPRKPKKVPVFKHPQFNLQY